MGWKSNGQYQFTCSQIHMAKENGICMNTLRNRVNVLGWDISRAITEEVNINKNKSTLYTTEEYKKANKELGLTRQLLYMRIKKMGWSKEKALTSPIHKKEDKQ